MAKSNVRVKLKIRGINRVMTSQGAMNEVVSRAQRIGRAAGENFEVVVKPHQYTARAYVRNANRAGAVEEARSKTLTRAIDAGR